MSLDIGPLVAVGRTSDVYDFGGGSVIKVPRPSVPPDWAAMEARFTAAVRELGAPAPAVHDVVKVDGRDAIVFERVRGPSMWDVMLEAPHNAPAVAVELADVHKRILCAGVPAGVAGLVERMYAKIADAGRRGFAERTEAECSLQQLPRGAALLHGDLHPGNVLMGEQGPIVVDWFDAAIGHPIADVVRSSVLLRPFADADDRPHLPGAPPGLLDRVHDSYLSAMSDVFGAPAAEVRCWEALVAASRLAEEAESDESSLLALWRGRDGGAESPLVAVLSAAGDRFDS